MYILGGDWFTPVFTWDEHNLILFLLIPETFKIGFENSQEQRTLDTFKSFC
jgi:hypothetical protein